ncbi:phosphate ABC transporter permease PstA [Sulfurospirillum sp. T05]|uniref:Phosphate transport system permease protein PstA n=1 Tax=Sulfurospirillum tamanense TaxID=2813362 RepID=A0ABS2WNK1_9BACT|nr:phosphate ABC transporter permease PstA [Sulfurospirillum tamanensis]MBN2963214.1 phosphate ABC transporter permease PstA [Sulfurospirillum tamanensis]
MKENNYFYIPQIKKRNQKAARFKGFAALALASSLFFLGIFLFDMVRQGLPALNQVYVKVDVTIDEGTLKNPYAEFDRNTLSVISRAWVRGLPAMVEKNPEWMNTTQTLWALGAAETDQYIKGKQHRLKPAQIEQVEALRAEGKVELRFNSIFFSTGDSKIPENAGFFSAVVGSVLTMLVTMAIAVPIGIMTAIYLEEFAPDNRLTQLIEININNLAAIPSILFGLLGLAIFINFFGVPRSSPLVGGMTLALMSLPVIIVSSKAALKSVPESIRLAGFGLGLTRWQIVKDHVLPLALPGMLTGSIIALAQAIGETAPLIMVGMIAFVPDAATSIFEAATVMPAQIYTWSGMPEKMYVEKTAAGILVLLTILLSLNTVAIFLRRKFTKKW